ncbi:ParA family protein [Dyadobacter flavalbus]|uniref:ParA family protein n=1 Tax=Dyadobacter flavalbus TaxID=2579942 RepID=A0A5M8QXW5_9BACT|nr:ParA family protein [Dyadobacter flavalbus]KAA6439574.1 ParA family protein [Dyadobacter flavalbus]
MDKATKIISFANMKGGVGKSMLTIKTALLLASEPYNYTVAVIDADAQGTIVKRRKLEESKGIKDFKLEIYQSSFDDVKQITRDLYSSEKYDYIFIDIPRSTTGYDAETLSKILVFTETVIVPLLASESELTSSIEFIKILKSLQEAKEKKGLVLNIFGLANKKRASLKMNDKVGQIIKGLKIDRFNTEIREVPTVFNNFNTNDSEYNNEKVQTYLVPFINEFVEKV